MEVILQDIKEELRRKYTVSGFSDSNEIPAYSTTDAREAPNVDIHHSFQNPTPSYMLPDSEITMTSDESSRCHEPREEFVGGMDQLATELEAELELLQLHLDQEHSQKFSQHPRAEVFGFVIMDPFFVDCLLLILSYIGGYHGNDKGHDDMTTNSN